MLVLRVQVSHALVKRVLLFFAEIVVFRRRECKKLVSVLAAPTHAQISVSDVSSDI